MQPLHQFFWANAAYILTGKLRSKHGYTPIKGHVVPVDFACVGVAAANNPQVDQYIVEQLQQLGVQRVRLDFSYDDFEGNQSRLLSALIRAGFKLHLHLVQPFSEAQAMETTEAQTKWQQFITQVCERYGPSITLLEIGSTINRKRWAGYTLQGFLSMWGLAYPIIKAHQIPLAGPSITDFEPLYNIGLFAILKARHQLPDIHTDNLFSERCTEPERDDHKILGHKLAPYGGFRLVKKAYVLQAIGAYYGVPVMHSPSAFWTLPRIARLLPDTLEKQADYLSRYMVLCAASGALQSAAWGPLICHREGLIDDGITPYPALERITYYQSVGDELNQYQIRPAFKAYQAFIQLISGLMYQGQLNHREFLEVHCFSGPDFQLHVMWTTNGKVAALTDLYTTQQLASVAYINRDGQLLTSQPTVVTESPLYIRFNQSQAIPLKEEANIMPSVAIHAHVKASTYQVYRTDQWRGLIAGATASENALLATALAPINMQAPSKQTTLRLARNAIWTIPDPRDPTKQLVVKQPVKMHLHKKWLDRYKPSKALRSWSGANELLRRGIQNAKPIAYFEHVNDQSLTQNFYICEYVPADFSVREMFSAFANGQESFQGISQQNAYQQVCSFLFNMHNKGVFFRDLSGGNILISQQQGTLAFSLIDTGRAHFFNHGTPLSKRLSDMARACNKLHASGRNTLMAMYMAQMGKRFSIWHKLPFALYNVKVSIKRKLKRKNLLKMLGPKKNA